RSGPCTRTRPSSSAAPRAGSCPASPTCIRMRSSAPWPAWPSARPTVRIRSVPGARRCTGWRRAPNRTRCEQVSTLCTTNCRSASRFDPDSRHAVTSQLYLEMLEAVYTTVCEFHYLHHAPDGRPYGTPTAMSDALVAAAGDTGIRLTLLPVLYMTGGFDGRPL